MKTFHPRLFNVRFFTGGSWSVSHGRYCRNQKAFSCRQGDHHALSSTFNLSRPTIRKHLKTIEEPVYQRQNRKRLILSVIPILPQTLQTFPALIFLGKHFALDLYDEAQVTKLSVERGKAERMLQRLGHAIDQEIDGGDLHLQHHMTLWTQATKVLGIRQSLLDRSHLRCNAFHIKYANRP